MGFKDPRPKGSAVAVDIVSGCIEFADTDALSLADAIALTSGMLLEGITFQADQDNADGEYVYFGAADVDVDNAGRALTAGDIYNVPLAKLTNMYVRASVSGVKLRYQGF